MIWWYENKARHRLEREAIEGLAASASWLELLSWRMDESGRLNVDVTITAAGSVRRATLRYPNHFPYSPALVVPTDSSDRWSGHQWGAGGELCLEWGPDNWQEDITGAMMLQSAHRLLSGEAVVDGQRGAVATRHQMSLGQNLRGEGLRVVISQEWQKLLSGLGPGIYSGRFILSWRSGNHVYHPIEFGEGDAAVKFPHPAALVDDFTVKPLGIVRLDLDHGWPSTKSFAEFSEAIVQDVGVLPISDVNHWLVSRGDTVKAYFTVSESDHAWPIATILLPPTKTRLPTASQLLQGKKVAVVGCGSLGSKVAVSLARSGVGSFLLVDDDLMLPENLVRHDLDYEDVGHHKADAVARRIQLVGNADIGIRRHMIGGQEASDSIETLIESIASCDIILDCTSADKAFGYLCAAAASGNKPYLSAEILAGGIGGRMMRCRPGIDPSPADARAAIDGWCHERGRLAEKAPIKYGRQANDNDEPMIATDADVSIVAGHFSRFAIDLLVNEVSGYPVSAYIFGFQEAWLFDAPFETWPIDIGGPRVTQPAPTLSAEEEAAEEAVNRDLLHRFIEDASRRK